MRSFMVFVFICIVSISCQFLFEENTDLVEGSECTVNYLMGVCTKASSCPRVKFNISSMKICSFSGRESVICCVRTSELDCNNYKLINGHIKRIPNRQHFVGGVLSKPLEHPHMAAIGWTQNKNITWKCGGSLISYNFVLTAAHCTYDRSTDTQPDVARIGVVDLDEQEPGVASPADYKIVQIIVHRNYKTFSTYFDIALLRVDTTNKLTYPKPICLWSSRKLPTEKLLGMGFGVRSYRGSPSNKLYQGLLNYVSNDECGLYYPPKQNRRLAYGIIESQMCAKDREGERDTCQGDSGGPLQLDTSDSLSTTKYLVGITSFGEGCLGAAPGVYTRVYSFLYWIESIVWPDYLKYN